MSAPLSRRARAKSFRPAPLLFAVVASVSACAEPSVTCADTDLVIGIQADPALKSTARSVRIVATDDAGEVVRTGALPSNSAPLFPIEVPLKAKSSKRLTVTTEAFSAANMTGLLVSRTAILTPECGVQKSLLRLVLQDACLGVVCSLGQTCQAGACTTALSPAEAIEPYSASWAAEVDACAPPGSGKPEVTLGTGQTDYFATPPDTTLKVEAGPQGGHHIWIGVRTKALHQRAATVTLNGSVEGTSIAAPSQRTVFSLRTDEGGYCKLYGLRYQLDTAVPISSFLGKPLRITVLVRDSAGLTATDDLRVMISDAAQGL